MSDNLWALDLDDDGQPWQAHLIVEPVEVPENGQWPDVLVAACGQRCAGWSHPRGWWGSDGTDLPLPKDAIHCGRDIAAARAAHATKVGGT